MDTSPGKEYFLLQLCCACCTESFIFFQKIWSNEKWTCKSTDVLLPVQFSAQNPLLSSSTWFPYLWRAELPCHIYFSGKMIYLVILPDQFIQCFRSLLVLIYYVVCQQPTSEAFGSSELFIDLMFSTIFFHQRLHCSRQKCIGWVSAKSWHDVTLPVFNNYFVLTSVFSNNYVHRYNYCISLCASFCKAHLVRALRTIFKVLTRVNRITSYVVTSEVLSKAHLVAAPLQLTILLRLSVFWNNTSLLWSK